MTSVPRPVPSRLPWVAALVLAALPGPGSGQTLSLLDAADSALATHPSVLAARARVDGADAGRDAARASYLPSLVGASSFARYEKPMVVAPLHGFDPRFPPDFNRTLVQSQLGVEYTLFDGGARSSGLEGATALRDAAEAGERSTTEDLLESVATAYLAVLSARSIREAADRQVAALDAERRRAGQRLQEGTAAQVDVLRAQAALQDALAQQSSAVAQVGLAERSLARLMGVDPSRVIDQPLADVAVGPAAAPPDSVEDPRVVAARSAVEAARARLGQERAGRLPSLKASGALLNFGSAAGNYTTEWQGGVRLSWPLFTGGARSAAIHRAEADERVAEDQLAQTKLAVEGALDQARTSMVEATGRAEALQASVVQWQEVARIEALSLETGAGVQEDFLRAEARLYGAQAGYARARYDVVLAHIRMARAQGTLGRAWMNTALEIGR
jgi:outer membrane protein